MFIPDNCYVKQIFRNDFVDMLNTLVNGTDYYTFQLCGNARSQGLNWYNQAIQSPCSAREYLTFINALDKQIEHDTICVVYVGTCDDDCVWVVCAE
jgi:hypothetical protein